MSKWAVLAPGESLKDAPFERIREDFDGVVAVNNAYQLALWADCLVAGDRKWWDQYKGAHLFSGEKWSAAFVNGTRRIRQGFEKNSGLLGIMVAVEKGAKEIYLFGFDMKGGHFFGHHPEPLNNPNKKQFERFKAQFSKYKPVGVKIINCNQDSALECYDKRAIYGSGSN